MIFYEKPLHARPIEKLLTLHHCKWSREEWMTGKTGTLSPLGTRGVSSYCVVYTVVTLLYHRRWLQRSVLLHFRNIANAHGEDPRREEQFNIAATGQDAKATSTMAFSKQVWTRQKEKEKERKRSRGRGVLPWSIRYQSCLGLQLPRLQASRRQGNAKHHIVAQQTAGLVVATQERWGHCQ